MIVWSGGQTGVDRAALDAALARGLRIGGYCTLNRRAEDGKVPDKYPLVALSNDAYPVRTEANVQHSTATLILYRKKMGAGTLLTANLCLKHSKPHVLVNMAHQQPAHTWECVLTAFAKTTHLHRVLNVAGSRESKDPGIYQAAYTFLLAMFAAPIRY